MCRVKVTEGRGLHALWFAFAIGCTSLWSRCALRAQRSAFHGHPILHRCRRRVALVLVVVVRGSRSDVEGRQRQRRGVRRRRVIGGVISSGSDGLAVLEVGVYGLLGGGIRFFLADNWRGDWSRVHRPPRRPGEGSTNSGVGDVRVGRGHVRVFRMTKRKVLRLR